jgi:CMP-N-acetylneuraminic acid synthetase
MKIIAIIPARGGSQGIPGKNIRTLAGKPLIAWTIQAAQGASSVDRVIVSTDSVDIATIAKQWNAEVIMRPAEISGDSSTSEQALLHVLSQLMATESYEPDLVVFLQCTSPLTLPADIEATVPLVSQGGYDCAFTMTPFHHFVWKVDERGCARGVNHSPERRMMRQERECEYLETGSVYVMNAARFREAKHRFFGRVGMSIVPRSRVIEIDDLDDWQLAEAMRFQLNDQPASRRPS